MAQRSGLPHRRPHGGRDARQGTAVGVGREPQGRSLAVGTRCRNVEAPGSRGHEIEPGDVYAGAFEAGALEGRIGFTLEDSGRPLEEERPDMHGGVVDRGAVIEDADRNSLLRSND